MNFNVIDVNPLEGITELRRLGIFMLVAVLNYVKNNYGLPLITFRHYAQLLTESTKKKNT
jgi:hypothetical protein